eukprot:scaffold17676_cov108-Isochrysis_galbana.AAC.2
MEGWQPRAQLMARTVRRKRLRLASASNRRVSEAPDATGCTRLPSAAPSLPLDWQKALAAARRTSPNGQTAGERCG